MDSEAQFKLQREWSERGLFLLRELLPLMSPVGQYHGWEREERRTLGEILSACARTSESTLFLCAYGQLWDADVLSRSVLEGTLKVAYLLQRREHFKQRHQEYSYDLFNIALWKDHKKVKELLAILPNSDAREWQPFREKLLSGDELADIERRYDRGTRRALDTKWGFTGLIGELSRSGDPLFAAIGGFCDGYATASHILHGDSIGVGIALERDQRSEKRRQFAHFGHLTRLILDQIVYLHVRLMVGYRYVDHSPEPLAVVDSKINALRESFNGVYESWLDIEYGNGQPPSN
jgi:hypothetical protein